MSRFPVGPNIWAQFILGDINLLQTSLVTYVYQLYHTIVIKMLVNMYSCIWTIMTEV